MRNRKIIYTLIFFMFLIIYCCGCSASWHVRKAQKKDPSMFETKSVIEIKKMELPPVDFRFDCYEFLKPASIELYSPILMTNPITGTIKKDSVRVLLQSNDSTGQVTATVDCPDPEVIRETVTETITLNATWNERILFMVIGVLVGFWIINVLNKRA